LRGNLIPLFLLGKLNSHVVFPHHTKLEWINPFSLLKILATWALLRGPEHRGEFCEGRSLLEPAFHAMNPTKVMDARMASNAIHNHGISPESSSRSPANPNATPAPIIASAMTMPGRTDEMRSLKPPRSGYGLAPGRKEISFHRALPPNAGP
jgi:hypothetical protein